MGQAAISLYERLVLRRPAAALAALLALIAVFATGIRHFRLDASSDSLVLEHDEDLRYYRRVADRYDSVEFVVVTYSPKEGDVFEDRTLDRIARLRADLQALERVESVNTVLDVPLLKNPPGTIKELKDNIKTLEHEKADVELARREFRESPLYQTLLVSDDLDSTVLQVRFRADAGESELFERRAQLRERLHDAGSLSPGDATALARVDAEYRALKDRRRDERHRDIEAIRAIIGRYRDHAAIHLGGVPMIVDDILEFIRNDLKVFGAGMLAFLVVALGVIFRRGRWVLLPMLSCVASVVLMMGLLGYARWDVTVVSSNFISLQLIFTMSLAIHIIVRFRELLREDPKAEYRGLIRDAVRATFVPCSYATLTTIAGFCSLVVSDILPVVNFGWMMTMGLVVSLLVTFILLPAGLALFRKPPASEEWDFGLPLTSFMARLTETRPALIFTGAALLAAATAAGFFRIEVENSFIDYFRKDTEIYQGMEFIDRELGGTTPLDVMIDFDGAAKAAEPEPAPAAEAPAPDAARASGTSALPPPPADEDFDMFGEFEEEAKDPSKYWFTSGRLQTVERVHDYLNGLEATGKVLSLATLLKTVRDLNEGKPFDDFSLAILFNSLPGEFNEVLVDPYVDVEHGQARITVRIKDSMRGLRRDALLKKIRRELVDKAGLREDQFRLTGLMVLYNNMLQSLFDSQIKTIGFTVLALMVMFLLLFRSLKIALVAIFPNLLSAMTVLGVMGLWGIPLDVMTITIVAISVGIAVDDTIHYLHRFKAEVRKDWDYMAAMHRCHRSIGNAMYYTTLTISIGFSILALSNFVPSILFGLLTALAMVIALVSALTLLPRLILLARPYGEGPS